jgi:hypothetical protein
MAKTWREGELIDTFKLTRIVLYQTPLMQEWLDVQTPEFNVGEQYCFDKIYPKIDRVTHTKNTPSVSSTY